MNGKAGFDTSVMKVNAQELPLVRTPEEDAERGKQLLLLLSLRDETLEAEMQPRESRGEPRLAEISRRDAGGGDEADAGHGQDTSMTCPGHVLRRRRSGCASTGSSVRATLFPPQGLLH